MAKTNKQNNDLNPENNGDTTADKKLAPPLQETNTNNYVGPTYKTGIFITKINRKVDPRKMTAKQIEKLIEDYPPAKEWFQ